MGADQNLIRAAAQMGPKEWDYSGIMKGIAALGKYAANKKAVASELISSGNEAFDIKEMPDAMMNGPFGEQNMDFLTGAKQSYNNSVNEYRKPLNIPSSKKYKQAVSNINNVQKSLEKNKADLLVLADVKKTVNEKLPNISNGVSRGPWHIAHDLQTNRATGDLDNAMAFNVDGVEIYVNDVVSMQSRAFNPSELLDGFFENHMNKDDNTMNLAKIIKNNGEKRKNTGKDYKEHDVRREIRNFMELMKTNTDYGNNGIKSLAFDFKDNLAGGTFVQTNANLFINPTLSGDDATTTYVDQYKLINPDATEEELKIALNHQAADVWDGGGVDYETRIEDWLVGIVKADYDEAQSKSQLQGTKEGKFQIGPSGTYVDDSKVFGQGQSIVNRIKSDQEFPIGTLNYKKHNGFWVMNDSRGGKKVKGLSGYYMVGDGSNKALHGNLRIVNDPRFDFLLN